MDSKPTHDGDGLPSGQGIGALITLGFNNMFRLVHDGVPNYEPEGKDSIAAIAEAEGRKPAEVVYDMLMENDGRGYVFLPLLNYANQNYDHIHTMFQSENTVLSLSDGGAHCGVITDASFPTYLLSHWVRDRSRGLAFRIGGSGKSANRRHGSPLRTARSRHYRAGHESRYQRD
jgi:N-acyl-D-aspartate/D-glutamate deacylase